MLSSTSFLRVLSVAALLSAVAFGQGLKCETTWTGPSSKNDIAACVTSTSRAQGNFAPFVPLAAVVIILVLFLLIFPIMCLWCTCCKCCCNCCKDVALGDREASKKSRLNVVVVIVIGLIMGVTALGVMLGGAPKVTAGADGIFTNLHTYVLNYFVEVIDTLVTKVKDPATGDFTDPFTNATFSSAKDYIYQIGNSTMKYRTDVTNYSELVTKVGYGVSVFPLVLIAITVLLSFCNCRFCLPTCCSCFYFLIFIIFSLIALILFIFAPIIGAISSEVDLQNEKKPGIFQWYVIPYCEDQANFTSLKAQVRDKQFELATKMCEEMSKYCSPGYAYDVAKPQQVFYCNMTNATRSTDCANFNLAVAVMNNTFTKAGAVPCGATNCSFRQCQTDCADPQMRSTVVDAIKNLGMAERLFGAIDYVMPLMDCNVLADRLLMMLKSMPQMRDGLWLLGAAFFIAQVMLVLGTVIMMLGAKLWFSQKEYEEIDNIEDPVDEMKEVKQPA